MPLVDNPKVRLGRSSTYLPDRHRVLSATEVLLKDTGRSWRDTTTLYPLTAAELVGMLPDSGLALEGRYADFAGRPSAPEDESEIAVLRPLRRQRTG